MEIVNELYQALDKAEKKEEKDKIEEKSLLAKEINKKDELSEKELQELIRRILALKMSEADRQKELKLLMERSKNKKEDISAMIEMEKLSKQAEQKREIRQDDEVELPDIEPEPFSYDNKKQEDTGDMYDNLDEYGEGGSEFDKVVSSNRSEFKEITKDSISEYDKIVEEEEHEAPSDEYLP